MNLTKIFVDLDGVLTDFSKGIKRISGKTPKEFHHNVGIMWKLALGEPDFFAKLDWMPDGKELWKVISEVALAADAQAYILSGIPHGKGWSNQKYQWVSRELGPEVPLIIKSAYTDKIGAALTYFKIEKIPDNEIWVLIDDQTKNGISWKQRGGVFIHLPEEGKNREDIILQTLEGLILI